MIEISSFLDRQLTALAAMLVPQVASYAIEQYRCATVTLGIICLYLDMRYFYGGKTKHGADYKRKWFVAWTHWSFTCTLLYFAAALCHFDSAAPTMRVVALGCTLSVDILYWFVLFPLRLRKGTMTWHRLTASSVAKHGGSLLWLAGDAHVSYCSARLPLVASPLQIFMHAAVTDLINALAQR